MSGLAALTPECDAGHSERKRLRKDSQEGDPVPAPSDVAEDGSRQGPVASGDAGRSADVYQVSLRSFDDHSGDETGDPGYDPPQTRG